MGRRPEAATREGLENADDRACAEFEDSLERLSRVVRHAANRREGETEQLWCDRVRAGLVALLGFFDDEPRSGRVLLLAGAAAAGRRRRVYEVLGDLLDEGCCAEPSASAPHAPSQVTIVELVVGGVFSLIAERMADTNRGALVELAPSLMAFIESSCLAHSAAGADPGGASAARGAGAGASRAGERPVRATYRTACVLRAIAAAPRSSNRAVAQAAGLTDEGQTSKLLGRLERRGVIENVGLGAAYGEPNQWLLTAYGQSIVNAIGHGFALDATGRGRRRVRGAA